MQSIRTDHCSLSLSLSTPGPIQPVPTVERSLWAQISVELYCITALQEHTSEKCLVAPLALVRLCVFAFYITVAVTFAL